MTADPLRLLGYSRDAARSIRRKDLTAMETPKGNDRFSIRFPLDVPAETFQEADRRAADWQSRGHTAYAVGVPVWDPDDKMERVEWRTHIEE
jgi:hypothetical protein